MPVQPGQRIGLTGGIGSGKSTVARLLAAKGAALIDADAISRATTAAGGSAIAAIQKKFGEKAIAGDGAMDRDYMRALVFSDPGARQQLEAIVHPLVGLESLRQAEAAMRAGKACTVFDIPLLVESGRWRQQLDHVLVVDCSEETQLARVMAREAAGKSASGWTPETIRKAMAGQASRSARRAAADTCIYNDGISFDELETTVGAIAHRFGL